MGAALLDPRVSERDLDRVALARDIGYQMAEFGMRLEDETLGPVKEGFAEAVHQGRRGRCPSSPFDRKLLRLKLSAWKRSRYVDDSVTAEFLEKIALEYCPVTRVRMTTGTGTDTDMTMDRVFNDGAYAIGNIVAMSARANKAKGSLMPQGLVAIAKEDRDQGGLTAVEWWRLACIASMASPPGYLITAMPMFVYPPLGLLVSNKMVVIQMILSQMGACLIGMRDIATVRGELQGKKAKKAFMDLVTVLQTVMNVELKGKVSREEMGFGMADAWQRPMVFDLYANLLKEAGVGAMWNGISKLNLVRRDMREMGSVVETWGIESAGYR